MEINWKKINKVIIDLPNIAIVIGLIVAVFKIANHTLVVTNEKIMLVILIFMLYYVFNDILVSTHRKKL